MGRCPCSVLFSCTVPQQIGICRGAYRHSPSCNKVGEDKVQKASDGTIETSLVICTFDSSTTG